VCLHGGYADSGQNAFCIQDRLFGLTVFAVFQADQLISGKIHPYYAAPQIPSGCIKIFLGVVAADCRNRIAGFLACYTPVSGATLTLRTFTPADGRG